MNQQVANKQTPTPVEVFRNQIANNESEFQAALPAHIPVERFRRVVTTAVLNNPDLLNADRRSLLQSAMRAAQDGLLPDGRDGAFVVFGKAVTWMPMVGGILKKIRNSGELKSISAYVAYSNDEFTYSLGDDEHIDHKPALENRGTPRLVYAIAKTKNDGIYREIMTVAEVEKVRSVSRAGKSGPWAQWWDEMAKKTVIRRLAKRLPMSSDLDDLIRRDDALYDFNGAREHAGQEARALAPKGLTGRLSALAAPAQEPAAVIEHDPDTGEIEQEKEVSEERADDPVPATTKKTPAKPVTIEHETTALEPDADDPAPTHEELVLANARAATMGGRKAYNAWIEKQKPDDIDLLKPHEKALREAAKQADARGQEDEERQ